MTKRKVQKTDEERMSDLEYEFITQYRRLAPGAPEPEYDVCGVIPKRRHRADFLWRKHRVIVEIDGGNRLAKIVFTRRGRPKAVAVGRHTQAADYDKKNMLVLLDYKVLSYTGDLLKQDPTRCINQVLSAIGYLTFTDLGTPEE